MQQSSIPDEGETWRSYLAKILREHPELLPQLEDKLNVQSVTVNRWLSGERTPHSPTLLRLPALVPAGYRERFRALLTRDFPKLTFSQEEEVVTTEPATSASFSQRALIEEILRDREGDIPATFVLQLIGAASTTEESLLFWVVSSYITQQLQFLLGEEIQVLFFRCVPPRTPEGSIRSLYHGMAQPLDAYDYPLFCGINQSPARVLFSPTPLLLHTDEPGAFGARSVCAVALQRRGNIAGCLVVLSTRSRVFVKPEKQALMRWYGLLAGLAFPDAQFHAPHTFALANLPSWERQRTLTGVRSFDTQFQIARQSYPETNQQELEKIVLWQLEQDLMKEAQREQQQYE